MAPQHIDGAATWDIRADKKTTRHLGHTYLFLLILMVWPLQSLHENMQMAGLVQTEGLPCQYSASNDGSRCDSPNWGQAGTVLPSISYLRVSTSSYFQLKGVADPFMVCLSNDLLRSPVCYVNFLHPQHCLARNAIMSSPLQGEYSYYVVSLQQTAFKRITTFLVSADTDHVSQGMCSCLYKKSNDTLLICWYRNLFQDYFGDIHLNVEWL